MQHWALTRDRLQATTTRLDIGDTTVAMGRKLWAASGVTVKGRTREQFLRNLALLVKANAESTPLPR